MVDGTSGQRTWTTHASCDEDPPATEADVDLDAAARAVAVRVAVGRLPASQREVVELSYFARRTTSEIAALLRVGPRVVHHRLARAKEALKRLLRGLDEEPRRAIL